MKAIIRTIVMTSFLLMLLSGCGKSQEQKQREAWEKAFKSVGEAIGETTAGNNRTTVDPGVTLFEVTFIDNRTVCWEITNLRDDPVTIERVEFNGEWAAPIADSGWLPAMPNDPNGKYPVTLTIGGSYRVFYKSMYARDRSYSKQIIYIDLYTDRGNFRYRPIGGFELLEE